MTIKNYVDSVRAQSFLSDVSKSDSLISMNVKKKQR